MTVRKDRPPLVCPVVTSVDIAWVCVATSDPNPLHLDRDFANETRGYKDVVAPGTMLIGWIGEYLGDWAGGPENVANWSIRFTSPVWPKDQITISGREINRVDLGRDTEISCEVTAAKVGGGEIVARASATLRIPFNDLISD